jgi:hypothetical protein
LVLGLALTVHAILKAAAEELPDHPLKSRLYDKRPRNSRDETQPAKAQMHTAQELREIWGSPDQGFTFKLTMLMTKTHLDHPLKAARLWP